MAKVSSYNSGTRNRDRGDFEFRENGNNNRRNKRRKKENKEEKEEKKKIIVSFPVVKTNLILRNMTPPQYGNPDDFDWNLYADGWNGVGLKVNKKATKSAIDAENEAHPGIKNKIKIYSHEAYAESDYKKYFLKSNTFEDGVKDSIEGNVVKIKDVTLIGGDELLISTSTGGAAIVNLAKENKFFELFGMTKEQYKSTVFGTEGGKKGFLDNGYLAKIEKNGRASLYEGVLLKTQEEFMSQIALGKKANKAYIAHITGYNKGGFICTVQGLRCFLPASQATANKVIDFESLIGTTTEVMIMKFIEGTGFLVSRKMYLARVTPDMIEKLRVEWQKNPEKIYRATVTGTQDFGVFLEINEFYTGLLHKMYVTEDTSKRIDLTYEWNKSLQPDPELPAIVPDPDSIPEGVINPGEWFDVIIYNITEDGRIVFTNIVDVNERKAVVEVREKDKAERDALRAAEEKAKQIAEQTEKMKKAKAAAEDNFKGESVSLEELKSQMKKN